MISIQVYLLKLDEEQKKNKGKKREKIACWSWHWHCWFFKLSYAAETWKKHSNVCTVIKVSINNYFLTNFKETKHGPNSRVSSHFVLKIRAAISSTLYPLAQLVPTFSHHPIEFTSPMDLLECFDGIIFRFKRNLLRQNLFLTDFS